MNNPVIIITGTRTGIGRQLAEHYTSQGYQVIGCSRKTTDFRSKNYHHFCLDITNEVDVKAFFKTILKTYKRLDILINNAAISSENIVLLTPKRAIEEVLAINFTGTVLFCREACRLMQKKKFGRIINISSFQVPLGMIGSSIYGASKAAVEQFTKVLAQEVFSWGITVNIVSLSVVKNSGMAEVLGEEVQSLLEQTISKSIVHLNDIVYAIDFLASAKSHIITNQTLYLGGI